MADPIFFVTTMPASRPADYYLGYLNGCVFLDFNNVDKSRVCLKRISFDGHGCCELSDLAAPLSEEDSKTFKDIIHNGAKDQESLTTIIKKTIAVNKTLLWTDALKKYKLI
jgi:hypothetical protein